MAATTNIFTEKQTNNWFKACIALNVTKKGLTNFVVYELQNVQNAVGTSCGQCSIENLIPCPTQGLCKKRKRHMCTFHNSQIPKSCKTCDQVKQNIKDLHRFGPSWRNTKVEQWATNPWAIGKCYLPPDGYSNVSSVQESDFNGVISIVLNCKHFETCLSPACLSPPPPDKQCLLEKIRQIGRDVRHTADCKVTDADLQDYFNALSTLLADPVCLMHDPMATEARGKLSDLQKDRLSLTELGEMLKEANQTLKYAQEVGKHLSETLTEGLNTLEATIQTGEKGIERKIYDAEKCLEKQTRTSIMRIKHAANEKEQEDYERGVADLLIRLEDHYRDTVICVPLSTLDTSRDKQVHHIYASPNIHKIKIENDGRRTKQEQIFTYKDCFYRDNQVPGRIYLQGEPGTGKTTFVAKLVHDWCQVHAPSMDATTDQTAFVDVNTLQKFKCLFFISLCDSRNQKCVTQMIKTQLIENIYADDEIKGAYTLVLQIMKNEMCLVIQDGLDEWPGENALPSMTGIHKDNCIVLTTSRPWKLTDERIRNSQIDILLELDGISNPRAFNEKVLMCLLDESKDLKETVTRFEIFLRSRDLMSISASPMLLTLVLCTWVDGTAERLSGSSLCKLYTILLENLCKKANPLISHFNKSKPAPVKCFSRTKYIKPNMQHLNDISKAAFSFLFSNERETAIIFCEIELSNYISDDTYTFALKSGLLSIQKRTKCTDNTCSFSHKSMQEFLAAYHISSDVDVIDGVISEYLKRHDTSYLDLSQVFVFLCGMNINAANKLSEVMNVQDIAHGKAPFQRCIVSGYREAKANKNDPIHLHLSNFSFFYDFVSFSYDYVEDLYNIWEMNTLRVRSLSVFNNCKIIRSQDKLSSRYHGPRPVSIPTRDVPGSSKCELRETRSSSSSCMEIDLSLCHNLERLNLKSDVIVQPDALVGLNNLKQLELWDCQCEGLDFSSCHNLEELNFGGDFTMLPTALVGLKKLKQIYLFCTCNGLDLSFCEYIESIKIGCKVIVLPLFTHNYKNIKHIEIMSTYNGLDLSLLETLETITISNKVKVLTKQLIIRDKQKPTQICLHGFDFTSSDKEASDTWCLLNGTAPAQCADSFPVLPSIKHIKLTRVECFSTWLRSLFSTLLTLDHEVECELLTCEIKSSVEGTISGLFTSGHTIIKTDLNNTLKMYVDCNDCRPGLWDTLYNLNIKSLRVGGKIGSLHVNHEEALSQSLLSLKLLETLTMHLSRYIDLQLPQSLRQFGVFFCRLSSSELRDLLSKLSRFTGPLTCRLEFGFYRENVSGSDLDKYSNNQFSTEEYILVTKGLEAPENIEVDQFKIYDNRNYTTCSWSVHGGVVNDCDRCDGTANDDLLENIAVSINNYAHSWISMCLQINRVKETV
ncbi:hypothetical protein DPMN_160779 [Dreissena polymorpha]|uniref:NACHT domain-containing protein n=1 Tax=Dreissena polymorpha TaxID=45954 RepID=A0A9D4ELF3_DREPO|nr:hypothetical protein DPMN_160779 [Dreissena polymorpha]